MDLIMASSRGSNLQSVLSEEGITSQIHSYPGGKYLRLAYESQKLILAQPCCSSDVDVYFLCGYPDITTKLSGDNY